MIQLHHCHKKYPSQKTPALHDITFNVEKGEFIFLTGPSGSGKTTLLKLLTCQERPTSGQVIVAGRNLGAIRDSSVPYIRRNIGMVFQDFKLVPYRTVFENVAIALEVLGVHGAGLKKKVVSALGEVGMQTKLDAYPVQLSGGEQQRVAIARAIINEPAIFLADEPTGNLDKELTAEVMRMLLKINLKGATVMVATHDPDLIRSVKKRVIELSHSRLVADRGLSYA